MSDKNKGYDDSLIDEVIAILDGKNDREIELKDFNAIQQIIKDHNYYDRDDIEFDEVMEYCNWGVDSWERAQILDELGIRDNDSDDVADMLHDVQINTLDDEYKMELLLKLYKSSSNITDLENMIRASYVDKVNNVIL